MKKLRITLYSCNASTRSVIRKAFKGFQYDVIEVTDSSSAVAAKPNERRQDAIIRLDLPDKVDFVVTTAALNSRTEGLAATLGLKQGRNDVYAVVLPEAMNFLREQLDKRGELVLVGADQAK